MKVQSSQIGELLSHKQNSGRLPYTAVSFDELLEEANTFKSPATVSQEKEIVPVGVISADQPTVSDVLFNNSLFRNTIWQIIHAESNAAKNYDRMQTGTRIFIDKKTMELIWEDGIACADSRLADSTVKTINPQAEQVVNPAADAPAGSVSSASKMDSSSSVKISLGLLSGENSTISHLLLQNPQFGRNAWRIIQADINREKSFAAIRHGEEIFINPQTLELSWERSASPATAQVIEKKVENAVPMENFPAIDESRSDDFSSGLVQAVQSYLGKPYREIDCYGLVVRGLSRMGIKYSGRGGLQNQLVQMAKSRGLSENAYMTGEGLIEVSGEKVFSTNLNSVKNVEKAADSIYNEMAPYLQKGYILSFSTQTRGHTGIVSQHDRMWTFINSGYMDNQVEKSGRTKGVGEEVLVKEIKNWCIVAARRGESLQITLGRLQEEKLRTAKRQDDQSTSQKVL